MEAASPQFSLAYLTVFGTPPPEMVHIAAETGYDYVSLRLLPVTDDEPTFPFFTDKSLVRDIRSKADDHGIQVLDVEVIRVDPGMAPSDFVPFLEVAAELGAAHVVTQIPESNRTKAIEQFGAICDLAAPYNLTADLEFIPWLATSDLSTAADIVEGARRKNGGVLLDTLHFARSDSSISRLGMLSPDLFNFIQLCDAAPPLSMSDEELIRVARSDRRPPGEGSLDLATVLAKAPVVPYSLEVPNDAIRDELGATEFSRRVLESAKRYLARANLATGVG